MPENLANGEKVGTNQKPGKRRTRNYRGGALIPGVRQDCDNLFFKNGMECQCALGAWPMVDAGFV